MITNELVTSAHKKIVIDCVIVCEDCVKMPPLSGAELSLTPTDHRKSNYTTEFCVQLCTLALMFWRYLHFIHII